MSALHSYLARGVAQIYYTVWQSAKLAAQSKHNAIEDSLTVRFNNLMP